VTDGAVTFDLSTDDGIRAAAESNPALKGYFDKLQADAANTARQQRDNELRRESGTAEQARRYNESVIQRLRNGEDPDVIARETPLWVKANEDTTRAELYSQIATHAASLLPPAEAAVVKTLAESVQGKPEEMQQVAQTALNAVAAHSQARALDDFDPDTIDKNSPTWARLQTWKERELTSEREAAAIAQQQAGRTNPPNASGTGPGSLGMTAEQARTMTPEQAAALPDAEFAEWKRLFFASAT
jgi:hypothetical protein